VAEQLTMASQKQFVITFFGKPKTALKGIVKGSQSVRPDNWTNEPANQSINQQYYCL